MKKIVQCVIFFCAASLAMTLAHAAIPLYVIPGALESDVRAALPLVDCGPQAGNPDVTFCKTTMVELDGMRGRFHFIFAVGRLWFVDFMTDRKNFAAAVQAVTDLLGPANPDASVVIDLTIEGKKVIQNEKIWATERLLAAVYLYSPVDPSGASITLISPRAVTQTERDDYAPLPRRERGR